MNSQLVFLLMLFAQNADGGKGPAAGGGMEHLFFTLLPFILIGVLFYYMLIRPQRREQAKRQDMLSNVKKNDRVVTIGGIYGIVLNVHREADEVTVKVDETNNTKLKMTLSSISRVLSSESSEEEETN